MKTALTISWMLNLVVAWYHAINTASSAHPFWMFATVFGTIGFIIFALWQIVEEGLK